MVGCSAPYLPGAYSHGHNKNGAHGGVRRGEIPRLAVNSNIVCYIVILRLGSLEIVRSKFLFIVILESK